MCLTVAVTHFATERHLSKRTKTAQRYLLSQAQTTYPATNYGGATSYHQNGQSTIMKETK